MKYAQIKVSIESIKRYVFINCIYKLYFDVGQICNILAAIIAKRNPCVDEFSTRCL